MAQIKRYPFIRHLRAEAANHILCFRKGKRTRSGRGLSFWFDPTTVSISEVPLDDREITFAVKRQSSDFQEVTIQGVIIWRVATPEILGERIDFTLDLNSGGYHAKPVDHIQSVLGSLVREFADTYLKQLGIREILERGVAPLQAAINEGFSSDATLGNMGLEIVSVRVSSLLPSSELARALELPTFESLQQKADEATFARRAMAVEKERAIAENELTSQVELATRKQNLIEREDANARAEAEAMAAAMKISSKADAESVTIKADAEAAKIRAVEQASVDMEKLRMEVYGQLDPAVLYAMAAQEFAGKLNKIDSISVTPDTVAGLIQQFQAITAKPQQPE